MTRTKPGAARIGYDGLLRYLDDCFANGNIATDGIQYSAVATVGTTAVEVFTALINPDVTLELKQIQVGLTQRFRGLNGSVAGSISYYWRARSEYSIPSGGALMRVDGAWATISAIQAKLIGTLASSEDTLSGNVSLTGIQYAPLRISLMATSLAAANVQGDMKSSSYVELVGRVIPGT